MVLTIFLCIVGLISGMGIYSALGLDDLLIIAPLIGGVIGILLGITLDKIMVTLKKEENKTLAKIVLFSITTIALGFCFYAFLMNWDYESGVDWISNLYIIIGHPISLLFEGNNLLITIAYIVIALFGVVISLIFGYSHLASKAKEHEGKYEVTVDRTTGAEVGERKMLDPGVEAFKKNALIVSLIMVGTLLLPFASFATGYYIVFKNKFDKGTFIVTLIYYVVFVILLYVLLFVLSPVQVAY